MKWTAKGIGIASGTILTLVALAGAAFWLLGRRRRVKPVESTAPAELSAGAPDAGAPAVEAPSGSEEADIETKLAAREALEKKLELQALGALKLTPVITKTAEVLARHLREKISKDPEVSAQVLRTWIRDE
jgi:flagellar biosynthesis/type III secretory pathway M-ring protein FliF/YscJ